MVKNVIKVFARLKKEPLRKKQKLENYFISKEKSGYEDIIIHGRQSELPEFNSLKYHKIFDQNAAQSDVFETVARPVVSSVIHGFNGTIFAYGQTGSGKTYSITGCPKVYENRGIIPRCLQETFDYLNQNPDVYTVHISYLEIYNEIGYDLLNPRYHASKLEELPRVILLEDGKGEAHLRNLSIHPVCTEKEAMRLLFLGDTNRTIAETPMNEYSSRSHCIFTIYLKSSSKKLGKAVRSKLHLVDLAGSERIRKSNITGTTLSEAKNINLSLHYLEQVIMALSNSKRGHVPFRNSMLTYLLKDSLSGNSLTTMIATLAITKRNIEETITTCRFAKRVAMISTDPIINVEEVDSQHEIDILQTEILELKAKLSKYENQSVSSDFSKLNIVPELADEGSLTREEQDICKKIVEEFLLGPSSELNLNNMMEMKYCTKVLKEKHLSTNRKNSSDKGLQDSVETLKDKLRQKEEEISTLKDLLELETRVTMHKHLKPYTPKSNCNLYGTNSDSQLLKSRAHEIHFSDQTDKSKVRFENDVQELKTQLEQKYALAKSTLDIIDHCKVNIINIRTRLEQAEFMDVKDGLNKELIRQQDIYRKTIMFLREIEKEANHLKLGLLQVEVMLDRDSDTSRLMLSSESAALVPCPSDRGDLKLIDFSRDSRTSHITYESLHDIISPVSSGPSIAGLGRIQLKQDTCTEVPSFVKTANESKGTCCEDVGTLTFLTDLSDELKLLEKSMSTVHDGIYTLKFQQESKRSDLNPDEQPYLIDSGVILRTCSADENLYSSKLYEPNYGLTSSEESVPDCTGRSSLYLETDTTEFKQFMETIPLTGDLEVDEEIFNFYRSKFNNKASLDI